MAWKSAVANDRSPLGFRAWTWTTDAPAFSAAAAAFPISSGVSGMFGFASLPWTPPVSAAVTMTGSPARKSS